MGFLGVLVIIRPGGGLLSFAVVFPLLSAFVFSLYQILTRKLAGRESPFTSLFYTALVGTLVTTVVLPFSLQGAEAPDLAALSRSFWEPRS